jgi:hypothetical protein
MSYRESMMSKHTPGPWTIGGFKDRNVTSPEFYNNCNPLARVYARLGEMDENCHYTWRDDEADANARLIAAAPTLLEALERVVNHVGHYGSMLHAHPDAYRDHAFARAAIALATGVKSSTRNESISS